MLQSHNFSKSQRCKVAKLQCCKVVMLQCCKVAKLQCCNVAIMQCCNLAKFQTCYRRTGGLLELLSQLKIQRRWWLKIVISQWSLIVSKLFTISYNLEDWGSVTKYYLVICQHIIWRSSNISGSRVNQKCFKGVLLMLLSSVSTHFLETFRKISCVFQRSLKCL